MTATSTTSIRRKITSLTPHANFVANASFVQIVGCLTRPYTPISKEENEHLSAQNCDVFSDASGNLYTFGDADGGKALMPLKKGFNAKILEAK